MTGPARARECSVAESVSKRQPLVLGSASPRRLELLRQIGVEPDLLLPCDLDETAGKSESPRLLAIRLAREKARAAVAGVAALRPELAGGFVLGADTVVSVGRRILPKCENMKEAVECLRLLSGRAHRVHTAVCLITPKGDERQRSVETRLRFKRLSSSEIEAYIESDEWRGKAGGYAIQGLAGAFALSLVGSYSSVVGLPLYETMSLLVGEGYQVHASWRSRKMSDIQPESAGGLDARSQTSGT